MIMSIAGSVIVSIGFKHVSIYASTGRGDLSCAMMNFVGGGKAPGYHRREYVGQEVVADSVTFRLDRRFCFSVASRDLGRDTGMVVVAIAVVRE